MKKTFFTAAFINFIITLAYVVTGWLSIQLATFEHFSALVFFPAGIALASYLTFRPVYVLPGLFSGTFLLAVAVSPELNLAFSKVIVIASIISLSVCLQVVIGKYIFRRFIKYPITLSRDRDIFLFLLLVPLICIATASIGFGIIYLFNLAEIDFFRVWLTWLGGNIIGIYVMLPLALSFIGRPRSVWKTRRWFIGTLFVLSVIIISSVVWSIRQFEVNRLADQFKIRTQEASELFKVALKTEELIQDGVSRLFASSEKVTREEFKNFVNWTTYHDQHIQVVEWLPRIEHSQRIAYEDEQKKYFGDDFVITEIVSPKTLGAAKQRDVYYPITYLEPELDNSLSRGFDPYSSVVSRKVIDQAIETGQAMARSPLKMIRRQDQINSLVIYRPIYQTPSGKMSVEKEGNQVIGLVNMIIRVEEFVEDILKQARKPEFEINWLDVQSGEYFYQQNAESNSDIKHYVDFELAGRKMQLQFYPTINFINTYSTSLASLALVCGFLITTLFTLLFLSITGRTYRISTEVILRTRELSKATSRAQESERRIRDVLKKMQLTEQQLHLSDVAFNSTSEAMMITDANKYIIAVNQAFIDITGYSQEEVMYQYPDFLVTGVSLSEPIRLTHELWDIMQQKGTWRGEVRTITKSGDSLPSYLAISAIYDAEQSLTNMVAVFTDMTDVKEAHAKIERHANFDTLTNLPNRRLFTDRLHQEIKRCERQKERICLMFLDLDRFKDVNDTLGHDFGDELLREMATRISSCIREMDTVARLGGDEFTIILSEFNNKAHAITVAKSLITEIEKPVIIKGQSIRVSTSIGMTFFPDDAEEPGLLIQNADRAMYAAKEMGGSAFKFYNAELESSWLARTFIINELESALLNGELDVHYQPIISMSEHEHLYAEALVRWNHPERGMIPPSDFLPQAERMGMIDKIDDYVFKRVCRDLKRWQSKATKTPHISINRSAHNFGGQRGRLDWLAYLAELSLSSELITLEITESTLMQKQSESRMLLHRLRDADIKIAVDDFGTGYSSLSYLKEMDVDFLKIDRSFIHDIEESEDDRAIVEAITEMAKRLDIKVIAEGVETATQADILKNIGCHSLQGFYYSKPLPVTEFEVYMFGIDK
jgi:diguanylate cyclase (GGDEF)-like protein/PAS domain S-box-containing protein